MHSGCTVLDCALGGGWLLGRVANVIGDKSTAKTSLVWEALTNFLHQYPKGKAAYRETEAAFDEGYGRAMGWPIDKVDRLKDRLPTVEAFERDIKGFIQTLHGKPGMYVLDSLDALSDEAELERETGEATYGASKAKALSAMFRKITTKVEASNVALIIVSQIRDKIGVRFGEKHSRSGGHALDFYTTHIVKLAHLEILKRTIKKVTRPVGIRVKARVDKNKVVPPFRVVEFDFKFGYGIDDVMASTDWLREHHRLVGSWTEGAVESMTDKEHRELQLALAGQVQEAWAEIETSFLPKRSKYAV